MILPRRSVELPWGRLLLRKGLFSLALLIEDSESADCPSAAPPLSALEFLPRYRRHADALAEHYQISEVQDGAFIGGIKALWQWIVEMKRPQARPRRPVIRSQSLLEPDFDSRLATRTDDSH